MNKRRLLPHAKEHFSVLLKLDSETYMSSWLKIFAGLSSCFPPIDFTVKYALSLWYSLQECQLHLPKFKSNGKIITDFICTSKTLRGRLIRPYQVMYQPLSQSSHHLRFGKVCYFSEKQNKEAMVSRETKTQKLPLKH